MARVYNIPRYRDQTALRTRYFINSTGNSDAVQKFGNYRVRSYKEIDDIAVLGHMGLHNHVFDDLGAYKAKDEILIRYAYAAAYTGVNPTDATYVYTIGKAICEVFEVADSWYSDFGAMSRILALSLNGSITYNLSEKLMVNSARAWEVSRGVSKVAFAADKLGSHGQDMVDKLSDPWKYVLRNGLCPYAAECAWRRILLAPVNMSNRKAHNEAYMGTSQSCDFKDEDNYFVHNTNIVGLWRIQGMWFVVVSDKHSTQSIGYILDHSAVMQIFLCFRAISNICVYFHNYRLSGNMGTSQGDVLHSLEECVYWIAFQLTNNPDNESLAKHMKLSLTMLENNYHPDRSDALLCTHWEERNVALSKDLDELKVTGRSWYQVVSGLGVTDKAKFDFAYLFHILPAPDCDIIDLYNTTVTKMTESNSVNPKTWKHFIAYTKSLLLSIVAASTKGECKVNATYDYSETRWWKNCKRGIHDMPPVDLWGKAVLKGHFPYHPRMEMWPWDAADVTHVVADREYYDNIGGMSKMPRYASNELLYALKHAPLLSFKYEPSAIKLAILSGRFEFDNMCILAAKSENTKPGDAQRETVSACDIMREFTSEADHQAIPISQVLASASLRAQASTHSIRMHEIANITKGSSVALIISLDIKGWSPNMCRKSAMEFFRVIFDCVQVPDNYDLEPLWSKMCIAMCRRGVIDNTILDTGMVQGFTGTLDTTLHSCMTYFVIRTAKEAKILPRNARGIPLTLIDDAVICVEMPSDWSLDNRQTTADTFLTHTQKVYADLGYIIETSKTLYSTTDMVYLNRFYSRGVEVLTPMKVFAKVGIEITTRFTDVLTKCDSILQSAKGAIGRGSDPVYTYVYAMYLVYQEIINTGNRTMLKNFATTVCANYLPRRMGGFGFPTIIQLTTNEVTDQLTVYTHVMVATAKALYNTRAHRKEAAAIVSVAMYHLNKPLKKCNARVLLKSGGEVASEDYFPVSGVAQNLLERKMKTFAESKLFTAALDDKFDSKCDELLDIIIKSGKWDASVMYALSEVIPDSLRLTLTDKATKSELLLLLTNHKERSELGRRIRKANKDLLVKALCIKVPNTSLGVVKDFIGTSHEEMAERVRDRYHALHNIDVVNHTIPYPIGCLARQSPVIRGHAVVEVHSRQLVSRDFDKGKEGVYLNLYDATVTEGVFHGKRSAGIYGSDLPIVTSKSPIELLAVKAIALCAYIKDNLGDGDMMYSLVCAFWGVQANVAPAVKTVKIKTSTSTKRVSNLFASRSHTVTGFPNCNAYIAVDSTGLQRFSDNQRTAIDAMGIVTTIRQAMILDCAVRNASMPTLRFFWSYGTVKEWKQVTISFNDHDLIRKCISDMADILNSNMSSQFIEAVSVSGGVNVELLGDTTDMTPFYIPVTLTDEAYVDPGQFVGISLMPDVMPIAHVRTYPVSTRTRGAKRKADTDVAEIHSSMSFTSRLSKIIRNASKDSGPILCAALIVAKYMPNDLPEMFYTAPWSMCREVAQHVFKDPEEAYAAVCGALERNKITVNGRVAKKMLLPKNKTPAEAWSFKDSKSSNMSDKLLVLGGYAWLSRGRVSSGLLYRTISASGSEGMITCHKFASKRHLLLARTEGEIGDHLIASYVYHASAEIVNVTQDVFEFVNTLAVSVGSMAIERLGSAPTHTVENPDVIADHDEISIRDAASDVILGYLHELLGNISWNAYDAWSDSHHITSTAISNVISDAIAVYHTIAQEYAFVSEQATVVQPYTLSLDVDAPGAVMAESYYDAQQSAAIGAFEVWDTESAQAYLQHELEAPEDQILLEKNANTEQLYEDLLSELEMVDTDYS